MDRERMQQGERMQRRSVQTRRGKKTPSYARMTASTQKRIAQTLHTSISCSAPLASSGCSSDTKPCQTAVEATHRVARRHVDASAGTTTAPQRPTEADVAAIESAFNARLQSFVVDLRARLQDAFDAEVAESLGERSQQDRQRNVYCGLSDIATPSAGDGIQLRQLKSVSFSPVPVSPEETVKKATQAGRNYGKSSSSCGVSPEGNSNSPQPSPSRGALLFSPKRESPIREQIADAIMPSPSSRAEDIDHSDSDSEPESAPRSSAPGAPHSVLPPPPLMFPDEETINTCSSAVVPSTLRACFAKKELEEFDTWQKRLSASENANAHPLFASLGRRARAPLSPTDEPARFIDWIAELNVFVAWENPLVYKDRAKHTTDVLHAVVMEACRGLVHEAALAAILA